MSEIVSKADLSLGRKILEYSDIIFTHCVVCPRAQNHTNCVNVTSFC